MTFEKKMKADLLFYFKNESGAIYNNVDVLFIENPKYVTTHNY